jgi:hypothetical protein
MDIDWIIPDCVLIDTLMERFVHQSDVHAHVPERGRCPTGGPKRMDRQCISKEQSAC